MKIRSLILLLAMLWAPVAFGQIQDCPPGGT